MAAHLVIDLQISLDKRSQNKKICNWIGAIRLCHYKKKNPLFKQRMHRGKVETPRVSFALMLYLELSFHFVNNLPSLFNLTCQADSAASSIFLLNKEQVYERKYLK